MGRIIVGGKRCAKPIVGIIAVVGATFIVPEAANASGFYVREQSTSAAITGFAGAASRGNNASHLFYNPATIVLNDPHSLTVGLRVFDPHIEIEGASATNIFGLPVVGRSATGNIADTALAGGLFASFAASDRVSLGIGVSGPFGSDISTPLDWLGRFQLTKSEMTAININPVLAVRLSDRWTVAGGLQIQSFDTDLRKFELIPTGGPFVPAEGFAEGDDITTGFTAGLLFEASPYTTLGVGYRSHMRHTFNGTAGAALLGIPSVAVNYEITTPDIITASVSHMLNPALTLHGTLEWANWSVFDELRIKFPTIVRPDDVRPQNWSDTWSFFGGASLAVSERTTIGFGGGYTQSVNNGAGSTIQPDSARITVSGGISHRHSDAVTIDLAYTHVFFEDTDLTVGGGTTGTFAGSIDSDLGIFSASATFNW